MGFLAPLYAMAALAIAAPILFHLIRRQPRGQSEFSSLMFLQPSPPRLTRRSRLDNLFLLLLRALALALIALAFTRPFLRSVELADARVATRELLLLIDTSGSMQRREIWTKAIEVANKVVSELGKEDRIGLATFDSELKTIVPLPAKDELETQSASATQSAVLSELAKLKPTYRTTRLAEQLMSAVELLQLRSTDKNSAIEAIEREIVLISDLHVSSNVEALQGFDWPENVRLDVRRIADEAPGNAHATVMQASAGEASSSAAQSSQPLATGTVASGLDSTEQTAGESGGFTAAGKKSAATVPAGASLAASNDTTHVRVRVENTQNATATSISLRWLDTEAGNLPPTNLQVPAGQVRVVSLPFPNAASNRIELSGDAAKFDNIIYVPRTAARKEKLGYVGSKRAKAEDDLFFFLSQVPLSTLVREVETVRLNEAELSKASVNDSLAGLVVEWPVSSAQANEIVEFVKTGRPVVVVIARSIPEESLSDSQTTLAKLLGIEQSLSIAEAKTRDFSLLTEIDFRHPLFQPLADAKFNDFGKVRFWAHRLITLPDAPANDVAGDSTAEQSESELTKNEWRVLARFDDKAPALIHRPIGRGDLWLLTAGWHATGSQLALSSKFVPLIFGMLDPEGRSMETNAIFEVGQSIPVAGGAVTSVTKLDGTPVRTLDQDRGSLAIEEPGLYYLTEDGKRRQIAVTLPDSESQLDPLDTDRFAQYGVITGKSSSAKERVAAARLSQAQELEGRQKLWRWLLVAVIGLLILETLIAGRLSHQ